MIGLSVILPVQEQEGIIEEVFRNVKKAIENLKVAYEIILVENGSQDKTFEVIKKIAKNYAHTVAITTAKGYGSAVLAGLGKAKGEYVCYMPSDGQVDLEVIPRLWELASSGGFDLVKVKRINRESWMRTLTSWAFSLVLNISFGTSRIDINGSPRILQRKKLGDLNLESKDSFIDAEMLIKSTDLGWKIKELPMKHLPRLAGKSTRSIRTYLEFFSNIYTYKFRKRY